MVIINTQGIVLKSVPYKENDLILTIFSRKLGKVSVIARGAKKSKSSLLSSSQIFAYSNFTLKREGNMYRVTQSEIIKSFYNLSYDFEAFSYATYILKLIDSFIIENQPNNRLFILLAQSLYLFCEEDIDMEYVSLCFKLKFLEYIGFKPIVNTCVSCYNKDFKNFLLPQVNAELSRWFFKFIIHPSPSKYPRIKSAIYSFGIFGKSTVRLFLSVPPRQIISS